MAMVHDEGETADWYLAVTVRPAAGSAIHISGDEIGFGFNRAVGRCGRCDCELKREKYQSLNIVKTHGIWLVEGEAYNTRRLKKWSRILVEF